MVAVPGVYNRGRWECWDAFEKEGDDNAEPKENDALATTDKNSTSLPTNSTAPNMGAEAINVVAIDNKIEQAMVKVKAI